MLRRRSPAYARSGTWTPGRRCSPGRSTATWGTPIACRSTWRGSTGRSGCGSGAGALGASAGAPSSQPRPRAGGAGRRRGWPLRVAFPARVHPRCGGTVPALPGLVPDAGRDPGDPRRQQLHDSGARRRLRRPAPLRARLPADLRGARLAEPVVRAAPDEAAGPVTGSSSPSSSSPRSGSRFEYEAWARSTPSGTTAFASTRR